MAIVGLIALIILGLFVLAMVYMGIRSVPDLNRYLRLRRM